MGFWPNLYNCVQIWRINAVENDVVLTDNGGEYEDTRQEVGHHKQILGVVLGRWRFANGRQRQRRPVERVDVLARQRGVRRSVEIVHPIVGAETERVADGKVEAGVPVDQNQNGEHDLDERKYMLIVLLKYYRMYVYMYTLQIRNAFG